MSASRFEMTHRGSCDLIPLIASSPLFGSFRPSTPFDSYISKIRSCNLRRITYFQKIAQLYQNNGLQTPQNHTLSPCCFTTPLESHTYKKQGWGGCTLTDSSANRESQVTAHRHPIDFCVHSVYREAWLDCHASRLLLAVSSPDPVTWGSRGAVSSFGFHISSFGFFLKGLAMATLTIFEKLDQLEARYEELTRQISSP